MTRSRPRATRLRWLGGALIAGSPLVLFGGCPGGSDGASGAGGASTGGVAGDSGGGSGGEAWDPVWHESKPKDWQTVGPEGNPDCGTGCRVALNLPMTNLPGDGYRFASERLVSESPLGLAFTTVGSTLTSVVPGGFIQPSVSGNYVAYLDSFGIGDGQIQLTSLITGETKIVFRYSPPESGKSSSEATALNSKYAFFIYKGIRSRNLQTGELSYLGPGACYSLCATESALLCESGKIYVIDPENGDQKKIDDGTELQFEGSCSADRGQYAWIDYRDPPGPGSNPFFTRRGGEVYVHDFGTAKTIRATFDSPDEPRAKILPAVGDGIAVWSEAPLSAPDPNPPDYGAYYAVSTALATLDLETGKRCQLLTDTASPLGHKSVHGRHVYAEWLDKKANETRLVDIDLDHPAFQWSCQMTPGWGQ